MQNKIDLKIVPRLFAEIYRDAEDCIKLFWKNPFTGNKEMVAMLMWPAHSIEQQAEAEKIYENLARFLDQATLDNQNLLERKYELDGAEKYYLVYEKENPINYVVQTKKPDSIAEGFLCVELVEWIEAQKAFYSAEAEIVKQKVSERDFFMEENKKLEKEIKTLKTEVDHLSKQYAESILELDQAKQRLSDIALKPVVFVSSMQKLLDLKLNAFAFELVAESYLRLLDLMKLPNSKTHIEIFLKGVVMTLRKPEASEVPNEQG